MEAIDLSTWADPVRNCVNALSKRGITPVDAQTKQFKCTSCQEFKVTGWQYQTELNGKWHDLNLVDRCLDCQNGRMSKETRKEIEKKRIENMMNTYWYIDPDLSESGFKNFEEKSGVLIDARKNSIQYTNEVSQNKFSKLKPLNLVLMGNPGTGKSHLATAIARTLRARGFSVGFTPTEVLLLMIKDSYKDRTKRQEQQLLKDIKELDVFVFDDIGVENYKMEEVSFVTTKMLNIINARKGKPTIYTTNLNHSNLSTAIGERAFSRLNENTKFIDMYADDHRKSRIVKE